MREDTAGGLRALEEGLAGQRDIGTPEDFPVYICLYAEALARAGRPEKAVEELQRELRTLREIGLQFWMPEVLRVLAEVMVHADPASIDAAREVLRELAALAERQGVHMLGLRTALTTGRLAARDGDPGHCGRQVAAALARVAEDDGSAEIAEARAFVVACASGADPLRCNVAAQ